MLVCGLPLPPYLKEKCFTGSNHINNRGDANFQDIFLEAEELVRGCLEATFPGAIIFEPLATFSKNEDTDLAELISSGSLSVWSSGDPVHLTPTAYCDLVEHLLKLVANSPIEGSQVQPRRRIERVVTRAAAPAATSPTSGW